MDRSGTDDESIVGDIAHIVARAEDGESAPRAAASLSNEELKKHATLIAERNKYANLILLCKIHHKQVDDQPCTFSVDELLQLKNKHEIWVRESLKGFDAKKQADDELYADYIDRWFREVKLRDWIGWTDGIFSSGQPKLSKEMDGNLESVRTWLLNRVWPHRYIALEDAFGRFRAVVEDFQGTFREYAKDWGDSLLTEKFYKRAYDWPDADHEKLYYMELKFDYHVGLVEDLGLEMTRAANRVCDEIRAALDPTFMLNEGRLMIREGPGMDMKWTAFVPEYRPSEKYQGLDKFKTDRKSRKECYGLDDEELPYFEDWVNLGNR